MKVMKWALVFIKGTLMSDLYILEGSACIDGVSTVVEKCNDQTWLWHLKLYHISERRLHELDKQWILCGDMISNLPFCETCVFRKSSHIKFS